MERNIDNILQLPTPPDTIAFDLTRKWASASVLLSPVEATNLLRKMIAQTVVRERLIAQENREADLSALKFAFAGYGAPESKGVSSIQP